MDSRGGMCMKEEIELNPTSKLEEVCMCLQKLGCSYEVHKDNTEKDYTYLRPEDVCITITNETWEYPMYIDLENEGEFTLSYYKWHTHYYAEEWDFQRMLEDMHALLKNEKCAIILNTNKRWIYSGLSEEKLDSTFTYQEEVKRLPREFQEELKQEGGDVELIYWDAKENVVIQIEK